MVDASQNRFENKGGSAEWNCLQFQAAASVEGIIAHARAVHRRGPGATLLRRAHLISPGRYDEEGKTTTSGLSTGTPVLIQKEKRNIA